MEDHSEHSESKDSPSGYTGADRHDGHGRGASLRDAADRGRTSAPLDEPMPVPPQGSLDRY